METFLIFQWVNFLIFVSLLVYFLREPVRDFLGDRREGIRKELNDVARMRLTAETRYKAYCEKLARTDEEIEGLKNELRQEGELGRVALIKKAKEFAEKIRGDGKRISHQELGRARLLLRQKALLLAVELASKEIRGIIDDKDQERLMTWGIKNLGEIENESFS